MLQQLFHSCGPDAPFPPLPSHPQTHRVNIVSLVLVSGQTLLISQVWLFVCKFFFLFFIARWSPRHSHFFLHFQRVVRANKFNLFGSGLHSTAHIQPNSHPKDVYLSGNTLL